MENIKLLKKAYEINFSKIEEGYLASEQWCYAESRNKAKTELLNIVECDDWKLKYEDEPINYLTIPVIRNRNLDLVQFEDKEVRRHQVTDIIIQKERSEQLDKMLNDDGIKYCYIVKRGLFYGPNNCGYTELKIRAGIYKKEDAIESAKSCQDLHLRVVDIKEHNNMIINEISKLKNRLIINNG